MSKLSLQADSKTISKVIWQEAQKKPVKQKQTQFYSNRFYQGSPTSIYQSITTSCKISART